MLKNTELAKQLYKTHKGNRPKVVAELEKAGMTWAGANAYFTAVHEEELRKIMEREALIMYILQPANLFLCGLFIVGIILLLGLIRG